MLAEWRSTTDPEMMPLLRALRSRIESLRAVEHAQKDGMEVYARSGLIFLQVEIRRDHMNLDLWLPAERVEEARASGLARTHPFMAEAIKVRFERAEDLTKVANWLEESHRYAEVRAKKAARDALKRERALADSSGGTGAAECARGEGSADMVASLSAPAGTAKTEDTREESSATEPAKHASVPTGTARTRTNTTRAASVANRKPSSTGQTTRSTEHGSPKSVAPSRAKSRSARAPSGNGASTTAETSTRSTASGNVASKSTPSTSTPRGSTVGGATVRGSTASARARSASRTRS